MIENVWTDSFGASIKNGQKVSENSTSSISCKG